jgi:hypothetical protein
MLKSNRKNLQFSHLSEQTKKLQSFQQHVLKKIGLDSTGQSTNVRYSSSSSLPSTIHPARPPHSIIPDSYNSGQDSFLVLKEVATDNREIYEQNLGQGPIHTPPH